MLCCNRSDLLWVGFFLDPLDHSQVSGTAPRHGVKRPNIAITGGSVRALPEGPSAGGTGAPLLSAARVGAAAFFLRYKYSFGLFAQNRYKKLPTPPFPPQTQTSWQMEKKNPFCKNVPSRSGGLGPWPQQNGFSARWSSLSSVTSGSVMGFAERRPLWNWN